MKIVLTHVIIINKRENSPVFLSMTLSCQDRSLTRAELLYDGPISEQFRGSCAKRMRTKFLSPKEKVGNTRSTTG